MEGANVAAKRRMVRQEWQAGEGQHSRGSRLTDAIMHPSVGKVGYWWTKLR